MFLDLFEVSPKQGPARWPARTNSRGRGAVLIVAGLIAACLSCATASAKELTFASYLPPSHLMNKLALPNYFAVVEKESNGSLTFNHVAGAQLFDNKASITATGEGLADATNALPAYAPNQLPHFNILFDMVGFVENPLAGAGAALETVLLHCPECRQDFKQHGVTFLASYATSSAGLFCTKPVATAEDIKGLKVRVSGAGGRLADHMGATPVRVAPADLVTSLERGNIDCVLGPLAWISSYNLFDTVKSIVAYPFGAFPNAISVAFNTGTWESLDDAQKQAIMKGLPALTADLVIKGYLEGHDAAIAKAKDSGIAVVEGGDDFAQLLAEFRKKDEAAVAETASGFGVTNAQSVIDTFKAKLTKWNGLVPKGEIDRAKFESLLLQEVYSKFDPAS